jgi:hypothetical protein
LDFLPPFVRIFFMCLSVRRISKVSARKNGAESVDANLDLPLQDGNGVHKTARESM